MNNILFVEDEQRGVNPYLSPLERRGFSCAVARNGEEAYARLRSGGIDVLSLDVMFDPGHAFEVSEETLWAGVRLLELIRQRQIPNCDPDLKVVVLTAVENPVVEDKIKKLGVIEYLKKPVPFEKVIATFMSLKS
jgi:CheY-like chemotaxis protein